MGVTANEVEEAGDGRDALQMLAERPFDVVLLDLVMPEMDGYETLSAIKSDDGLADPTRRDRHGPAQARDGTPDP